jgi:hypothetical protein
MYRLDLSSIVLSTGNSKGKGEIQGFFTTFRMTTLKQAARHLFAYVLEAGWGFGGYVESVFEGDADAGYGAFVEEAAYEGDAVGDSAG